MIRFARRVLVFLILVLSALHGTRCAVAQPASEDSIADLEKRIGDLRGALAIRSIGLRTREGVDALPDDLLADAEIHAQSAEWAWTRREENAAADMAATKLSAIERAYKQAMFRSDAILRGETPWTAQKGRVTRGYYSSVDGSIQPYGVVVPAGYDPTRPTRLDVVLHGSVRPTGSSMLDFISRFDPPEPGAAPEEPPPDVDYIELHPLGRVENCYRWAGETDVWEAIEAVCRNYRIDRDRIVLRGMSMGASGTWHLGLKRPDRFAALGPYCGYVDTRRFSRTPLPNFVVVDELPEHQDRALHMLDSVDYCANAGVTPIVACMGEKDIFFEAHQIMAEAMRNEGLELTNLISPGTGHVVDPVTHAEQMRRLGEFAARGIDHRPPRIRFVTWTLKYSECHWLRIIRLGQHYARSEIEATLAADNTVEVAAPVNIETFEILPIAWSAGPRRLVVAGREIPLVDRKSGGATAAVTVTRDGDGWRQSDPREYGRRRRKRPGLQGPIDDAFTTPFLLVQGTGQPWSARSERWAFSNLERFRDEWRRYFFGEAPFKLDVMVTTEDLREKNLILFGDPGSNSWIAKLLEESPVRWTRDELEMNGQVYRGNRRAPAWIQPSCLAVDAKRYVVVNSGHTFHESELGAVNYLLFPRLGDWAVFETPEEYVDGSPANFGAPIEAGFFDEDWRFAAGLVAEKAEE